MHQPLPPVRRYGCLSMLRVPRSRRRKAERLDCWRLGISLSIVCESMVWHEQCVKLLSRWWHHFPDRIWLLHGVQELFPNCTVGQLPHQVAERPVQHAAPALLHIEGCRSK